MLHEVRKTCDMAQDMSHVIAEYVVRVLNACQENVINVEHVLWLLLKHFGCICMLDTEWYWYVCFFFRWWIFCTYLVCIGAVTPPLSLLFAWSRSAFSKTTAKEIPHCFRFRCYVGLLGCKSQHMFPCQFNNWNSSHEIQLVTSHQD